MPKKKISPLSATNTDSQLARFKALLEDNNGDHATFIGSEHIMTPGDLVFDPHITDGSVRYWCALRALLSLGEVRKSPTLEEMALRLNINRKTASTYFAMLRATRWLTVLKTLKQNNLEVGYAYVLSDHRTQLESVLKYDDSYIDFLLTQSKSKNKKLREYSFLTVSKISDDSLSHQQIKMRNKLTQIFDVQNLPIEENSVSKIRIAEKNDEILGVQNSDSGKKPDVQSLPIEENSVSKIRTAEKNDEILGVQNSDSGDNVINNARTSTPTHNLIPVGDITKKPTSTSKGSGGKLFDFMNYDDYENRDDVIAQLKNKLENNPKFGRKGTHAIFNLLKAKRYEKKNGETFEWIAKKSIVRDFLATLLATQKQTKAPLPYLKALITKDYQQEFLISEQAQKILFRIISDYAPDEIKEHETRPMGKPLSKLEQFQSFIFLEPGKRDYKPVFLSEGMKVKALEEIPIWGADKNDIATIEIPSWAKDSSNDEKQSCCTAVFGGNKTKAAQYDALCKAIELNLIELV